MMFNNLMAFAIKVDNNVVKEDKDKVMIPFGSEYSLFIKNLNSRKAIVKITIDGTDVCDGGFVVDANSSIDIERFVKDNDSGNRFKFIERTGAVEKSRGIGIEDGLIRIEYQFAKEEPHRPVIQWGPEYTRYQQWNNSPVYGKETNNNPLRSMQVTPNNVNLSASSYSGDTPEAEVTIMTSQVNDVGITVPGSISDQKFITVEDFPLEETKHVMIMHILGVAADNTPVKVATPSRQKQKCVTCGRINKASAKFCTECGTSLIII